MRLVRQAYNPVRWVETIQKMAPWACQPWQSAARARCWPASPSAAQMAFAGVALADAAAIEANIGLE
jgi:[acyl-carrier-protein] S-malonyltransferase